MLARLARPVRLDGGDREEKRRVVAAGLLNTRDAESGADERVKEVRQGQVVDPDARSYLHALRVGR